jgi:2-amino-4-hydroxy-6-hydroxymethyldihydropteridine diphosphokinase
MNVAYLLIGGNMGDRLANLLAAKKGINQQSGLITTESHIYETAAWGLEDQPSFLNQALEVETHLDPMGLLKSLLQIEKSLGRVREKKFGPRLIDIDILLFNNDIINEEGLKVPHPQLPNRRFALQCLADIAGHKIHPLFQKSIYQLLQECTDPLEVHKFN